MPFVIEKEDIARQGHPVIFRDLAGLFGAGESRRRRLKKMPRISALHIESKTGLRVGQFERAAKNDGVEVYRITGGDGFHQAPIGVAIDFAELVVRQSLAEIADSIAEQIFVAIVLLIGQRAYFLK